MNKDIEISKDIVIDTPNDENKEYIDCSVSINMDNGEDIKVIKGIEEKILKLLVEEKAKNNIEDISINTNKIREKTIKEAFECFYTYKVEEGVSQASLRTYKAFYKYLLYFCNENKKIANFDSFFFSDMFDNISDIPKEVIRKKEYDNKKFNEIIKNYELSEYEKLSNKYINRIFRFYKNLFEYFEIKHYITNGDIVKFNSKKETTQTKLPFTNEEINILKNIKDPMIKNYLKIGLYTGMRIQEITLLTKKSINLEKELIYITREETKTEAGQRVIPIHPNILPLIKKLHQNMDYDYLVSEDGKVNAKTKIINREINKYFSDRSKSFHSLRKNFTQRLYFSKQTKKEDIEDTTIKRIIGHSLDDITFEIYNLNQVEIETLRKAINSIEFEIAF